MSDPEKRIKDDGIKERISGAAQVIIGEIETIGGVLTADPITQAEGEFNVEVGTVREAAEDDLESGEELKRGDAQTQGKNEAK